MSDNGGQDGIGVVEEIVPEAVTRPETKPEKEEFKAAQEGPRCGKKVSFSNVVYETGLVAAKTVTGVALGAAVGIGAIVAVAAAEVTLPALLIMKTFGLAGGAVGFLKGLTKKKDSK